MSARDLPVTTAVRALRAAGIPFVPHLYPYEDRGGARRSAECLGVDEHAVVKTLVMETDGGRRLLVLMHGDREVATGRLARHLGVRDVRPCRPPEAERATGYRVGGTSPFGTRTELPVYVERTILGLDRIWINGGKRGFLVEIAPGDLGRLLRPEPVDVATPSVRGA